MVFEQQSLLLDERSIEHADRRTPVSRHEHPGFQAATRICTHLVERQADQSIDTAQMDDTFLFRERVGDVLLGRHNRILRIDGGRLALNVCQDSWTVHVNRHDRLRRSRRSLDRLVIRIAVFEGERAFVHGPAEPVVGMQSRVWRAHAQDRDIGCLRRVDDRKAIAFRHFRINLIEPDPPAGGLQRQRMRIVLQQHHCTTLGIQCSRSECGVADHFPGFRDIYERILEQALLELLQQDAVG